MKKILSTLLLVLVVVFGFVACDPSNNKAQKLDNPILSFDEEKFVVNWQQVEDAIRYKIYVDNESFLISENVYTLSKKGNYKVGVEAVGNGVSTVNSDITYIDVYNRDTIAMIKPNIFYYNGEILFFFENETFIERYDYWINGVQHSSLDYSNVKVVGNKFNIKVVAKSNSGYFFDSEPYELNLDIYSEYSIITTQEYNYSKGKEDLVVSLEDFKEDIVGLIYGDLSMEKFKKINIDTLNSNAYKIPFDYLDNIAIDEDVYFVLQNKQLIKINLNIADNRTPEIEKQGRYNINIDNYAYLYLYSYNKNITNIKFDGTELSKESFIEEKGVYRTVLKIRTTVLANYVVGNNVDIEIKMNDGTILTGFVTITDGQVSTIINSNIYYKLGTGDLEIKMHLPYGEISGFKAVGLNIDDYYTNKNTSVIHIKEKYLSQFQKSAMVEVSIAISVLAYDLKSFICIKEADIPLTIVEAEKGPILFDKHTSKDLALTIKDGAMSGIRLSFDGVLIVFNTSNYTINGGIITLRNSFITSQKSGRHILTIHTSLGNRDVIIDLTNSNYTPYNVKLDVDSDYPNVFVNYNCDIPSGGYIQVKVGNSVVDSLNNNQLFSDGKCNITQFYVASGKIEVSAVLNGAYYRADSINYEKVANNTIEYLTKKFSYLGDSYNYYITSETELEILVHYMIIYNLQIPLQTINTDKGILTLPTMKIYIAYGNMTITLLTDKVSQYRTSYREAVKMQYVVRQAGEQNVFELSVLTKSTVVPDSISEGNTAENYEYNIPYQTSDPRTSSFNEFKINNKPLSGKISMSDELFYIVERGQQPNCIPGSPADVIYNIALEALRNIVDDTMNDYQKMHAIYDWIIANTIYDAQVIKDMAGINANSDSYDKFYGRRCFYLEGVFLDGVAVCNGLAKAVVLMCGIEGIESVKVNGKVGEEHAWNKVKINNSWYLIDTTWGSRLESSSNKEFISHEYLLKSSFSAHKEYDSQLSSKYYTSRSIYGFYESDIFAIDFNKDGKLEVYDHIIQKSSEVSPLIEYYIKSGKNSLEVFIAPSTGESLSVIKNKIRQSLQSSGYTVTDNFGVNATDKNGSAFSVYFKK